jgi:hypothetical protein
MNKGTFFVYRGYMSEGAEPVASEWGLEVDHVNDLSKEGEPSALGYTLYHAKGEFLQNWLNLPTLFPHFFHLRPIGREEVRTPIGVFPCVKTMRGPENFCAVNKYLWYHEPLGCLMKIEVKLIDDAKRIYDCSVVEVSGDAAELLANVAPRGDSRSQSLDIQEQGPLGSGGGSAAKLRALESMDSFRAYSPQVDDKMREAAKWAMEYNLERQRRNEEYERALAAWKKLPFLRRIRTARPKREAS